LIRADVASLRHEFATEADALAGWVNPIPGDANDIGTARIAPAKAMFFAHCKLLH
jgi:hypothetical protein